MAWTTGPDMRTVTSFPDPVQLKRLLEEMGSALSRAGFPSVAPQLTLDHPGLVNSLQEVLRAIERDSVPPWFRGGGVATLFSSARLDVIHTCLHQLRACLLNRVLTTLSTEQITVLRALLVQPVPDFLDILGLSTHENTNSSLLAWLLDPATAPTIGPASLISLAGRLDDGELWCSRVKEAVSRRTITFGGSIPLSVTESMICIPGGLISLYGPRTLFWQSRTKCSLGSIVSRRATIGTGSPSIEWRMLASICRRQDSRLALRTSCQYPIWIS